MADDISSSPAPMRLMNFVSEEQLAEAKNKRGERVEDGTAQRDRPLFEILKENKDKRDAEFNERFKHRPPKALDEDETEFLQNVESSRKHYEQQIADEEALQLRTFQEAVAAQSAIPHEEEEVKDKSDASTLQDHKRLVGKKTQPLGMGMIIKVKPQPKKPKLDPKPDHQESVDKLKTNNTITQTCIVSYSDESDDDD